MSAANSPSPNNMLLLAAIGIGAFWLMTRRATAAPAMAVRPSTAAGQQTASTLNAIGGLISGIFRGGSTPTPSVSTGYYTGRLSPGQYGAAAAAAQADSNPDANGSVADWVGGDGLAFNPPGNVSPYDAVTGYGDF